MHPIEDSARRMLGDLEDFVCREPVTAVAVAIGVGLLFTLVPARTMAGTAAVLGATLMRPALISLGVVKAVELCCEQANPHASLNS